MHQNFTLPRVLLCLVGFFGFHLLHSQSFQSGTLNFNGFTGVNNGTALQFGPDGKLYVAEEDGLIKVYTIQRNGLANYAVNAAQTINLVQVIPNHNDNDGSAATATTTRQVTGIYVTGTAANPVIYVPSSDRRRGGGGSAADANLDTNSGVITRLTWNGTSWIAVDIVRGLPRSEENHDTNGLQVVNIGGTEWLIVCIGGFTNAGSPSNNFAYITEYALSGAVLAINLTMLNTMPILNDGSRNYIYNLPTLDDPTRANANGITDPDAAGYNGIDLNDPWGGNDGLNQSMLVQGGPVQMFAPGFRNAFDLVVTQSGHVYVSDNGANGGWGGYPLYEGNASLVSNNYRSGEPGSTGTDAAPNSSPFDPVVNNKDHLNLVTTNINSYVFGSVYGGHPCPVRANQNAGLFTRGSHSPGGAGQAFSDSYFRTKKYDPNGSRTNSETDPQKALPANWPPVPPALLNGANADFRQPTTVTGQNPDGANDIIVLEWGNNTNALAEYTASNFGGVMQGDLIAGRNGNLHRVDRNGAGNIVLLEQNKYTVGGNALGLDCQGDTDIFPGTIWVANYSNDQIVVLEPTDFLNCLLPGDPGYLPTADNDNDGYTNDDEIQNGSDPCSGASRPNDFDNDLVSDLLDLDDDADGINDNLDPFQMGQPFNLPVDNELFLGTPLGGYLGLGFTGLMNNGAANPNYLNWQDKPFASNTDVDDILGGAIGAVTMYQTTGSALANNQEKGYQFGLNVSTSTGPFTIHARMFPPFHNFGPGESQALFIGDGFQNNYLRVALGQGYQLSVGGENGGIAFTAIAPTAIGFNAATTTEFDVYFVIDPVAGTAQIQYSINSGTPVNLGSPVSLQGAVLTAVQNAANPLAVGIMGTASVNDGFAASWDFIKAFGAGPFVTTLIPDLSREVSDPAEVLNLNNYFGDDQGVGNLTYSVFSNTNPQIGAVVAANQLTVSFPLAPATSDITIRATDGDNFFVDQTFTVTVTDPPQAVFRVNANGPLFVDADVNTWEADNYFSGGSLFARAGQAIASTVNDALYQTERYGNFSYNFPVTNGAYVVELHFAEIYFGLSGGGSGGGVGSRVFNVSIEGTPALTNFDIFAEAGPANALIKTFPITVTDGTLNIQFTNVVNNAKVSAIAILNPSVVVYPPITVNPVPTQFNQLGETPILSIVANGGNPSETFTFSATGLPPGLSIEPTNGAILGTVNLNASSTGVYQVEVTVDKPSSFPVTVAFEWMITSPSAPTVIYRVNAGGTTQPAADGSALAWGADDVTNPSRYLVSGPNNFYNGNAGSAHAGPVIMTDPSVPPQAPQAMFNFERGDISSAAPIVSYGFPVPAGRSVEVRIYFCELFGGINGPGQRVFDISVDGNVPAVFNDIDMYAIAGPTTAFMRSVQILSDGLVDINLVHGSVENPAITGIEIVEGVNNTLPLEWVFVDAQALNERMATVRWGTTQEENNAGFVVEKRYQDSDFFEIGQVPSLGGIGSYHLYDWLDNTPMEEWNYYRIRQVDFDGKFSYSPVVELRFENLPVSAIRVFPNPVSGVLTIETNWEDGPAVLRVTDLAGRVVWAGESVFENRRTQLDTESWPQGIYVIQLRAGGKSGVVKVEVR